MEAMKSGEFEEANPPMATDPEVMALLCQIDSESDEIDGQNIVDAKYDEWVIQKYEDRVDAILNG